MPRAVANQISSLCARELGDLSDQSFSSIDHEVLVHVWDWTSDFDTDRRVMSPRSVFRAQSSRDTVEFEVGEAFVERGGSVVGRVG